MRLELMDDGGLIVGFWGGHYEMKKYINTI